MTTRAALNRAASALQALNEALIQKARCDRKVEKLKEEYAKLARRAAMIKNANMKSGPLTVQERGRLRTVANMAKTMSVSARVMRRTPLPKNLQNMVTRATLRVGR
jgi:hypothetical protein